jgi:hypothetical protein
MAILFAITAVAVRMGMNRGLKGSMAGPRNPMNDEMYL